MDDCIKELSEAEKAGVKDVQESGNKKRRT